MTSALHHPADIFAHLSACLTAGQDCALVVVTAVTGGAMRAPGALMSVAADGDVRGYVSNGCVDADIVFQALEALREGQPRALTYGEGSPFRDIQLPCGGRIDLVVLPRPDPQKVAQVSSQLDTRNSADFQLSANFDIELIPNKDYYFSVTYNPKIKLRIAGRGEAVSALARQAVATGFQVQVLTPEPEALDEIGGAQIVHLTSQSGAPALMDDAWTAIILMFHDHDWEPELLASALAGPSFYIGAMGSRRTHSARLDALRARGVSSAQLARIHGPIGLIPAMRDANLLALSALAEIVQCAQMSGRL